MNEEYQRTRMLLLQRMEEANAALRAATSLLAELPADVESLNLRDTDTKTFTLFQDVGNNYGGFIQQFRIWRRRRNESRFLPFGDPL